MPISVIPKHNKCCMGTYAVVSRPAQHSQEVCFLSTFWAAPQSKITDKSLENKKIISYKQGDWNFKENWQELGCSYVGSE